MTNIIFTTNQFRKFILFQSLPNYGHTYEFLSQSKKYIIVSTQTFLKTFFKALNFTKHFLRRVALKFHLVGQLFGRVLRSQTFWRQRGGHSYFTRQKYIFPQKNIKIMISHHQSVDNIIVS